MTHVKAHQIVDTLEYLKQKRKFVKPIGGRTLTIALCIRRLVLLLQKEQKITGTSCGASSNNTTKYPFSFIGMDHIGPFRRSERGNRYILVAIDYLSKWIIAKPVVNTSAALIRQFIQNDIITQHSYPHRIITDRGSGFRVKSLQTQLQKLGIEQSFSTTEHPQSNGQVERNNGSLLMAFKAYVKESHTN